MAKALYQSLFLAVLAAFLFITIPQYYATNALERYVQQPDQTFAWEIETQTTINDITVTHVKMTSQTWRDHVLDARSEDYSPENIAPPRDCLTVHRRRS